ncbi:MAG: Histidine triad (HIT) protein [candidate division TM6 bacterium GW2011_GWF2_37_49]|nr:MAG: Histidine triad (HIT) protein [candidate division TM6 bacterium GW2011_GWF2_37_49]
MERKILYAPWRHEYVNRNRENDVKMPIKNDCIFCHQVALAEDDKFFIIKRFKTCFVMMNKYPYNIGHLMVLPYDHISDLRELKSEIRAELFDIAALTLTAVEKALKAKGFNLGINMGVAGGGGIPSHLHLHILPRWFGDTNFLETIGEIKMLSSDIQIVYQMLKDEFKKLA